MFQSGVLIVTAALWARVHSIQVPCGAAFYDPFNEMACCGPLTDGSYGVFNYFDDICCGGEISAIIDFEAECCNNEIAQIAIGEICCGTSTVSESDGLCCQGTPNSVADPTDVRCCGTGVFNTAAAELCCAGNSFAGADSQDKQCCGQATIPAEQVCCDGQGVVNEANADDPVCCRSSDGTTTVIDSSEKCCNGAGVAVGNGASPDQVECCGVGVTTTDTICCGDMPRDKDGKTNPQCCPEGEGVFEEELEICCGGVGVGLALNSDIANNECCGAVAHDSTITLCCISEVVTPTNTEELADLECCGIHKYNPTVDLCCVDMVGIGLRSAGDCCGNTPFTPADDVVQCCGGTATFNPNVEDCCNGVVLAAGTVCCAGEAITTSPTQDCCNQRVQYNPSERKCCGPYLLPLNGASNAALQCCQESSEGGAIRFFPTLFAPDTQACCRGRVQDKDADIMADNLGCCSNSQYDTSTHKCCRNRIFPQSENPARCRGLNI